MKKKIMFAGTKSTEDEQLNADIYCFGCFVKANKSIGKSEIFLHNKTGTFFTYFLN